MNSGSHIDSDLDFVVSSLSSKWEQLRGKKIFLTGGTGFVGKWILGALIHANQVLNLDCKVTVLSRNPEAFRASNPYFFNSKNIIFVQGDLRTLSPNGEKYDYFIHAAADVENVNSCIELFESCTLGTMRTLEFASKAEVKRFLFLSSGAVYGRMQKDRAEFAESDNLLVGNYTEKSAYALGKISAEWLVTQFGKDNDMQIQIARCFAFVGPFLPTDKHFAIGNFIQDALTNRPIQIKGDGTALRSYLYAADLTIWLMTILLEGKPGACYNVGGETPYSMSDLAKCVVKALGSDVGVLVQGRSLPGATPDRYLPSTLRARSELGLKESFSLEQSIVQTAEFIKRSSSL